MHISRAGFLSRAGAAAGLLAVPLLLGANGTASATAPTQVSLGDSYPSGPAVTPQDPRAGDCLRSLVNYPHVAAAIKGYQLTDGSCQGAGTADMFQPQAVDVGPKPPPQLDALTPTTAVVTLTIGGNDIGFTNIIENCGALTPNGPTLTGAPTCKASYTAGGTDRLAAAIRATRPNVDRVLRAIHTRSPKAHVFVVGYPDVLPQSGPGCWPFIPLTQTDVSYINGVEKKLDRMLADSASANTATFVDTFTPTIGHDACKLPTVRYVEPLFPGQDAYPVHPNRAGEAKLGRLLAHAIR
ncbi:MAG TPA: SGNH/GDSL hydrolase family protein [Frankiaceae bacterium]|nr:SGNH/GDSL hydrolase family protein [Frankiaceae bacterium]